MSISWHTGSNCTNCNRGGSQTKDWTPRIRGFILIYFLLNCCDNQLHLVSPSTPPVSGVDKIIIPEQLWGSMLRESSHTAEKVHSSSHLPGFRRNTPGTAYRKLLQSNRGIMYNVLWELTGPSLLLFKRFSFTTPPPSPPQTSSKTVLRYTWWGAIHFRYVHVFSGTATWKCLRLKQPSNQTRSSVAARQQ